MKKVIITITCEVDEQEESLDKSLDEVASACFVQLEGLTDDFGINYNNPTLCINIERAIAGN